MVMVMVLAWWRVEGGEGGDKHNRQLLAVAT